MLSQQSNIKLTLASAFYIVNSKFSPQKYEKWFSNLLPNVKNFNLVIFCNDKSKILLEKYTKNNKNIKLIILNIENFYNYKYKNEWIKNHKNNSLLNEKSKHNTCWELNMLWSEKISFVKNIVENKYFTDTEWYGWCDIGYFRCENRGDISPNQINIWPNNNKILKLEKEKIYYALVNRDMGYLKSLFKHINIKNNLGLPKIQIPPNQVSIAGGFFLIHKLNINLWHKMYDTKLNLYFKHNYLVKDDQIIIINNIAENKKKFKLINDKIGNNPWFVFQRYLL